MKAEPAAAVPWFRIEPFAWKVSPPVEVMERVEAPPARSGRAEVVAVAAAVEASLNVDTTVVEEFSPFERLEPQDHGPAPPARRRAADRRRSDGMGLLLLQEDRFAAAPFLEEPPARALAPVVEPPGEVAGGGRRSRPSPNPSWD